MRALHRRDVLLPDQPGLGNSNVLWVEAVHCNPDPTKSFDFQHINNNVSPLMKLFYVRMRLSNLLEFVPSVDDSF